MPYDEQYPMSVLRRHIPLPLPTPAYSDANHPIGSRKANAAHIPHRIRPPFPQPPGYFKNGVGLTVGVGNGVGVRAVAAIGCGAAVGTGAAVAVGTGAAIGVVWVQAMARASVSASRILRIALVRECSTKEPPRK